jgi:hypothetical protein
MLSSLQEVEAFEPFLFDIPIPLQAMQPVKFNGVSDQNVSYSYCVPLTRDHVISYLTCEMERLGWQQLACVEGESTLLTYSKPKRICSFEIDFTDKRKKNMYTKVMVFAGSKYEA